MSPSDNDLPGTGQWRLHFIVGMSRSGITWLCRCLNQHPDIAVFGQSRYWGKHFVQPADGLAYNFAELNHIHTRLRASAWDATVGEGPGCLKTLSLNGFRALLDSVFMRFPAPVTPADLFLRIAVAVADQESKKIVFEKTPHHINHMHRIVEAFPESRFIVLVCGPYDYIRVQKAQSDLPYHPVAAALLWRNYMKACEIAVKNYGDRAVVVRFEDLMSNPFDELSRLQNYFDLPPSALEIPMPPLRASFDASFDAPLTESDLYWMNRICGELLMRNGYTLEQNRPTPWALLRSMASLPGWALENLRANWSDVEGSLVSYYRDWLTPGAK